MHKKFTQHLLSSIIDKLNSICNNKLSGAQHFPILLDEGEEK